MRMWPFFAMGCLCGSWIGQATELEDGTTLFTPPEDICVEEKMILSGPPLVVQDHAPLRVNLTRAGVTLDARGVTAGRVLVEMGRLADQQVRVEGWGARVRIWAHVVDSPWNAVFEQVLLAAGLVEEYPSEGLEATVADGSVSAGATRNSEEQKQSIHRVTDRVIRASRERSSVLLCTDPDPMSVAIVQSAHPLELGRVLARTILGCEGRIIAAPSQGLLLLQDREHLNTLVEVSALLDGKSDPQPVVMPHSRESFLAFHETDLHCEEAGRPPADNLRWLQRSSRGQAAGDLLRRAAVKQGVDVIVGCGGGAPAYLTTDLNTPLHQIASLLDLEAPPRLSHEGGTALLTAEGDAPGSLLPSPPGPEWLAASPVYVSREMNWEMYLLRDYVDATSGSTRTERGLETYRVSNSVEFAEAIEYLSPTAKAGGYEVSDIAIVWGTADDLAFARVLAEHWNSGM